MTYSVNEFGTLTTKFPSWSELESYLTSPDGGSFRVVGEGRYRIVRYVKGISDLRVPHGKWMRSVIWDTEENLPVCVAPPKAEKGEFTGELSQPALVQDFLDGMMINVFRSVHAPSELQIATRTQIGATGHFYSKKSFAQLFEEALAAMRMTKEDLLSLLATPTEMVPNIFASLILQHPEHRVVARCRSPHLWVVHTGAVQDNGCVTLNEECTHWPFKLQIPTHRIPAGTSVGTFFSDLCTTNGWFYQGLTVKDGFGKRWRLRNPTYLYLRALRGSEATAVERFLRLRSESKISEYLKHYSEDRPEFWTLEQKLRICTDQVYQGYCDVHKAREKKLEDLPWEIRPCVFKLHSLYLEQLRPKQEKVLKKHAVELVNNLPLYEQKRLLTPPLQGGLVRAAAALAASATSTVTP